MTPEHTAGKVPVESDGAVTLSLVERLRELAAFLRSSRVPVVGPPGETELRFALSAEQAADEIERLYSQGGAPEPTDDMAEAGRDWAQREWKASGDPKGYLDFYRGIYRAMLSAAPQPPVSQSAPDGWREALPRQDVEGAAFEQAKRLAIALHAKHYADNTRWRVDDDLLGVILQIDNMTSVLVKPDALSAERARVIEECAKVAETMHSDDDRMDRQVKLHVAAAIRSLNQGGEND